MLVLSDGAIFRLFCDVMLIYVYACAELLILCSCGGSSMVRTVDSIWSDLTLLAMRIHADVCVSVE